ncbi:Alpha-methylacyl-CoA racemase [Nymphon striatum]|nr:Alpha-methylacyl-CoA racemase [Nymphon striatum]
MFDSSVHAMGSAVIPAGTGQTELQVQTISDLKPDCYIGTPSFLKIILEKAEALGSDVSSLNKALVTGEALPPSIRAGFAEKEIVRPGTGDPVEDGEVGEVIVTSLNPEYPLIRFATGDLSAIMDGESPCGRTNKRIKGWMGRADQTAKVRGMFVHPEQVDKVFKRHEELSKVRLVVEWENESDQLTLKCETDQASDELKDAISNSIREICKVRGDVEFVEIGSLPNDGTLADLGADVIKVEPPAGDPMRHFMANPKQGDEYSPIYQHLNRGKRIVKIDLKQDSGKQALSFGQNGPYEQRAGHDLTYCAVSGALSNSGTSKRPVMSFPPVADHAGAMQATNTILAALLSRTKTNTGAFIDVSLYESVLAWQYLNIFENNPEREASLLNGGAACYNIYQTADGRFIALAPLESKFWIAFCEAVTKPEWLERQSEPLPQTSLIQAISDLFITQPLSYWNDLFKNVDCCYEPILLADEVAQHSQVVARNNIKADMPQFPAWINGQAVSSDEHVNIVEDTKDLNWL